MKKKLILVLSVLGFITACSFADRGVGGKSYYGLNEMHDDAALEKVNGVLRKYLLSDTKNKFIFKTSKPIRTVLRIEEVERPWNTYGDISAVRFYASTKKDSILHAIIEAYHFCKIDNPINFENLCIPYKVGDFDINQIEKLFIEEIITGSNFEAVIKNLEQESSIRASLKGCGFEVHGSESNEEKFSFLHHHRCQTSIRFNPNFYIESFPDRLI
tara:strand:+ start:3984 stop:4628 length:645 start_codon:yes stop_codon:yes gene_type:complete